MKMIFTDDDFNSKEVENIIPENLIDLIQNNYDKNTYNLTPVFTNDDGTAVVLGLSTKREAGEPPATKYRIEIKLLN